MSPEAKKLYKPRFGNIAFILSTVTYVSLYALQFFLDATLLLSILAAFIGFVATTTATLYFYVKGIYKTKKNAAYKVLVTMTAFLIEVIPEVDLIPGDILDIGYMFLATRAEDEEIAEGKVEAAAKEAKEQQQRAVQYAQYIQRKQLEQENAIAAANDNEREAAANDNALLAANDNELGEEANDEADEFEYQEAA